MLISGMHELRGFQHVISGQGRPSPRGSDAFPSVSDFSTLFPKHLSYSLENVPNFIYSRKNVRFKFPMKFFRYRLQIYNFSPIFGKNIIFPYFCKLPPDFVKFTCIFVANAARAPSARVSASAPPYIYVWSRLSHCLYHLTHALFP